MTYVPMSLEAKVLTMVLFVVILLALWYVAVKWFGK